MCLQNIPKVSIIVYWIKVKVGNGVLLCNFYEAWYSLFMAKYTANFFDQRVQQVNESASTLIPIVNKLLHPESVLDVGCAQGEWLAGWQKNGVKNVFGVDGDYVDEEKLFVPRSKFLAHDLELPFDLKRKYGLVMSLEVAEHLDKKSADLFIDSLTRHSDLILFSAAIPGQRGTHHVNEQWPTYWEKRFKVHGYDCYDVLRRKIWSHKKINLPYRQNVLVYATKDAAKRLGLAKSDWPLDIVHPELFEMRTRPLTQKPVGVKPQFVAAKSKPTVKQKVKSTLKATPAAPVLVRANKLRRKVKDFLS